MTGATTTTHPRPRANPTAPPAWARRWAGDEATLVSLAVADARSLDAAALRSATAGLYRELLRRAAAAGHRHLIRVWNHVPDIHGPLGEERDRYRVFNAGRFDALTDAYGGRDGLAACTPAASAVGHGGGDLVVHALAAAEPGRAVENPRQVPAYRYSGRFGRLPPCFARATLVRRPRPAVLVAGTAAITGELSRHPGDVAEQLDLTLDNLRGLLAAAGGPPDLRRFGDVRVYVPRGVRADRVRPGVRAAFPAAKVAFRRAALCRAELLVEIEGVAGLGAE